jgi:hypothetical protein
MTPSIAWKLAKLPLRVLGRVLVKVLVPDYVPPHASDIRSLADQVDGIEHYFSDEGDTATKNAQKKLLTLVEDVRKSWSEHPDVYSYAGVGDYAEDLVRTNQAFRAVENALEGAPPELRKLRDGWKYAIAEWKHHAKSQLGYLEKQAKTLAKIISKNPTAPEPRRELAQTEAAIGEILAIDKPPPATAKIRPPK